MKALKMFLTSGKKVAQSDDDFKRRIFIRNWRSISLDVAEEIRQVVFLTLGL